MCKNSADSELRPTLLKDYFNDCYFCMKNGPWCSMKKKKYITYQNLKSAIRPVRQNKSVQKPSEEDNENSASTSTEPHFLNQSNLYYLVRNLNVSKLPFATVESF